MKSSRRGFLAAASAFPALLLGKTGNDIRIEEIEPMFEDFRYRTPYKFGGVAVDRVTMLHVRCLVRGQNGKVARGFASMSMGNVWAFPTRTLPYATTLNAMKRLSERIAVLTRGYQEYGHPIDINVALEPEYLKAAAALSQELQLSEPIPKLCTLVTASPFDAALHDAYGKLHGRNAFDAVGREYVGHDLSRPLGARFAGEYLTKYLLPEPQERIPMYHSVGASDPITAEDLKSPLRDGLPETLPEWVRYSGLTHIKIKLNGDDMPWDVDRVVQIERATAPVQDERGVRQWQYILDFNERCPNVDYLLGFLRTLQEKSKAAYGRIQYIEQPTKRDLQADRQNVVHAASKMIPVVIDESLTDVESLLLAKEMGYTGAALKACKGQSQVLLMAAMAQKEKMFLCVQDLTCPGAALIHSAELAARVPGVRGVEANAREYVPSANYGWDQLFPGLFDVRDGWLKTGQLRGPGLGAVV